MLATMSLGVVGGAASVAQVVALFVKALLLTLVIAGAVALAVVAWPVIQQALIALPLIALYGWATYPRKAVRK